MDELDVEKLVPKSNMDNFLDNISVSFKFMSFCGKSLLNMGVKISDKINMTKEDH